MDMYLLHKNIHNCSLKNNGYSFYKIAFQRRYYGARYQDPKTSRWLSTDPALGEYIPGAPVNDQARKRNGNLPGMGGVFNTVNLHLYHYAGNNPVKYTDPNGMWTFSIGLSGGATYGMGVQGSVGVAFGYSKEDGFSIGVFASGGMSSGLPPSAGVGATGEFNYNAESVGDLSGESNSIGGGLAIGAGITVDIAVDENAVPTPADGVSITVGLKGTETVIEGHMSTGVTKSADITSNEAISGFERLMSGIKSTIDNFISDNIIEPILESIPQ